MRCVYDTETKMAKENCKMWLEFQVAVGTYVDLSSTYIHKFQVAAGTYVDLSSTYIQISP